jgi:hypothetical protein
MNDERYEALLFGWEIRSYGRWNECLLSKEEIQWQTAAAANERWLKKKIMMEMVG